MLVVSLRFLFFICNTQTSNNIPLGSRHVTFHS